MSPRTKNLNYNLGYLLLALSLLILSRLLFLLKAPLSFYGYDYGFYLYAINHIAKSPLSNLQTVLWGGYNNPLFYLSQIFHVPPAIVLNELYFLAAVFLGFCFYLLFKKDRSFSIFAIILTAFSLIQIEGYSMFLWKNVIALPFLILAFKFLMEKRWRPLVLSSLMILITHRTTAIVYLISLAIYITFQQIRQRKFYWLLGELTTGVMVFILLFSKIKPIIINLISHNNYYVRTGLFLERENLFLIIWPYLLLALPGLYLYLKDRQHYIFPVFSFLCLLWFVFQLPFYRRFLIYLDLSLIIYAAYFLAKVNYSNKYLKIALAIVLIFLAYRSTNFVLAKQPLILPSQVEEIKNFKPLLSSPQGREGEGDGFVLAVSANDAPWLLGYTKNVRLGAPGLFEDPHTYQQWKDFWQGKNQIEFISKYPRPLYFYQRSYRLQNGITKCFIQISENFFKHNFDCLP